MSPNAKKAYFPSRITISVGAGAGPWVDEVFLSYAEHQSLLTAAEEKLRIAREALEEIEHDPGDGQWEAEAMRMYFTAKRALAKLGGADERE